MQHHTSLIAMLVFGFVLAFVLGALANLLQNSGDGNVLSTPNLLTLDNEEAKILIGENVPFPTGSYANTGGSTNSVNPFTTVERKDVGLTLRVKPQINENGTVKLVIYQEISAVKASSEESKNGPTTTKRSIESTVLVEDGSIIVLGGLLQDKYSGGQDKVPLRGDIPGVGALFRSDTRSRQKTNLMVFLRPVVLRSATASTTTASSTHQAWSLSHTPVEMVQREIVGMLFSCWVSSPPKRGTTHMKMIPTAAMPEATSTAG